MQRRLLILLLAALGCLSASAGHVFLIIGENRVELTAQQTQTEVRAGWRIVDIQLKGRTTRYLAGGHSNQLTDGRRPTFIVEPSEDETLVDYALIRLDAKRSYRRLPRAVLRENDYQRLEPEGFEITPEAERAFVCTPRDALQPGEYILVCLTQQPQGDLGDYAVYAFRVESF